MLINKISIKYQMINTIKDAKYKDLTDDYPPFAFEDIYIYISIYYIHSYIYINYKLYILKDIEQASNVCQTPSNGLHVMLFIC